jgi:hypothetical protein
MKKLSKKATAESRTQAHGGVLLAAIQQHLIQSVPGFAELVDSEFFRKTVEASDSGFTISFVFLQNYHTPTEELDEIVLAQIMIFLANTDQLELVKELVVNLTTNGFGSE